jgi:DoxX-like family
MKLINIFYWLTTILLCVLLSFSAYNDLMTSPEFVSTVQRLGFPVYLLKFLGVAKFAAIVVILSPIKNRLKDWAYAGVTFDLFGAAFSHYSIGDSMQAILLPIVGFVVAMFSYIMYMLKYDSKEEEA